MKAKLWICLITLVISAALLRSYVREYHREQDARGTAEPVTEEGQWENTQIRVLIKSDHYEDLFHDRLEITGTRAFYCETDGKREEYDVGDMAYLDANKSAFSGGIDAADQELLFCCGDPDGELVIKNLKRQENEPSYRGSLRITGTDQGYVVINEVLLEDYLPAVISSEMPASFPEEALRAQAVCARTYALKKCMEHSEAGYGANLDDSVLYQVYNNRKSDGPARKAVLDTRGLILAEHSTPADIYYYSTSCGVRDADDLSSEEAMRDFLGMIREADPERESAWYRWHAELTWDEIRENLRGMNLDVPEEITGITVAERSKNGQVNILEIHGGEGSLRIEGEYQIRRCLKTSPGNLVLQDGSFCDSLTLLPSAWFVAEASGTEVLRLLGGGYGHGNGMSQSGARGMALEGKNFREILAAYYPNTTIIDSKDTTQ